MLKINYDGTDLSVKQSRYEYIECSVIFDGTKSLLIGYYKPIHNLYFNIPEYSGSRSLTVQYYNGSTWLECYGLIDETFGLTRPAFIQWDKNQTNEAKTTLVSTELYWYKITPTAGTVALKGVNLLFSNDLDLVAEYPSIMEHLPDAQESFVRFHEVARNDILTELKRSGVKINGSSITGTAAKALDAWDLLDLEEVRQSAKYSTLNKIFTWLSDSPDDNWSQLANKYMALAGESIGPVISVDINDNGKQDEAEANDPIVTLVGRL
jgi:hypothetical protein